MFDNLIILFFNSKSRLRRDSDSDFKIVHNQALDELHRLKERKNDEKKEEDHTRIDGIRIETSERDPSFTDEGVPELMSGKKAVFRLFGSGFSDRTVITFTEEQNVYGGSCLLPASGQFKVKPESLERNTVLVEVVMPKGDTFFYFCTKTAEENGTNYVSDGCTDD